MKDSDTGKYFLEADFYDVTSFQTIYLLVPYSSVAEHAANFGPRAEPGNYTSSGNYSKLTAISCQRGVFNAPTSCNSIHKGDSKRFEALELGQSN